MALLRYSIADMIDRLTITLLKHWHLEEEIAKLAEEIESKGIDNVPEEKLKEHAEKFERSAKLNQYRNQIIESINEFFEDHGHRESREK